MKYPADPRIRQTLNQITENLESANQKTQASLFTFSELYIQPCVGALQPCFLSFQTCLEASCQPCCSARDDVRRHRQPRHARRGREAAAFDFYDEWDQEEDEWGNDEMDRLLTGPDIQQPGRQVGMSYGYGTRGARRKSIGGKDAMADDPTLVPQSSIFGFLERLPWKIGGRGTRYRPNPANLQENIGKRGPEVEPLIADDEGSSSRHGRKRSITIGSKHSANSLSSRGDIFPSDDEDDAREIDDEFALRLGRRSTGATSDDRSSKKRPRESGASTRTTSSKDTTSLRKGRTEPSASNDTIHAMTSPVEDTVPSIAELKRQEEEIQRAEETEVQQKREAAQRLATERGLEGAIAVDNEDSKEASLAEIDMNASSTNDTALEDKASELLSPLAQQPVDDEDTSREAGHGDNNDER